MIAVDIYKRFSKQNITGLHGPSIIFNLPCYHCDLRMKEEADILKVARNNNENLDQYLKHLACRCEHVIYDIYASLVDCKVREFYQCIYVTALVSS